MGKDFKVRRYGYDRQQKRKQGQKKALVTVAAVLVAAVAGWFLYEPVFQFVTEFHLPDRESQEEISQSSSGASDPEEPPSSQPPAVTADAGNMPGNVAYLPTYLLGEKNGLEAALGTLKGQGIQGVVVELKSADGQVLYQSGLEIVQANVAQSPEAYDLASVTEAIRNAGLTPVGRIWTFRDRTSPTTMYEAAVKYMDSNINWLDNAQASGGKPWLNPNSVQAQDYILELIQEAAGKGVEAVILDGMQFPEGYSLDLATYGTAGAPDKSQILADFAARARQAGEDASCQVWPVITLAASAGTNPIPYGDAPEKILEAAGRGIINVSPEQFGTGVATEDLTLSNPAMDPYGTVKAGLEASMDILDLEEIQLGGMVQAYTSTTLPEGSNKAYGAEEINAQIQALEEAGIDTVFYYSPSGAYPLS